MAITWNEAARGGSGETGLSTNGTEVPYKGRGAGSTDEAKAALFVVASAAVPSGLTLDYVRADDLGSGSWEGIARYKSPDSGGGAGTVVLSFNTTGGTKHFTQSKGTTGYAFGVSTPPDVKGTIGEVDDGVPAGVDVVFPQFEFQLTIYKSNDSMTDAYIGTLAYLTARTNSKPFRGFQGGEVLFLGAQGAKRSGGDWELGMKFAASPNRTNVPFGIGTDGRPLITVPSIKGWDHVDVHYEWWESQNKTVKVPVHVYVHKVYDEGDFAQLLL